MSLLFSHFVEFVRTPAGVLLGIGLCGVLVGGFYDCVLRRRIRGLK